MGEATPQLLIKSKKFWKGVLLWYLISGTIFVLLLLLLGASAASINTSKEETGRLSRIVLFILKYILGFPVGLFLDYASLKGLASVITLLLLQPVNSFIQFFAFSWLRQRLRSH